MYNVSQAEIAMLTGNEVLAVSQDPLEWAAHFMEALFADSQQQVWAGKLSDSHVTLLTNGAGEPQNLSLECSSLAERVMNGYRCLDRMYRMSRKSYVLILRQIRSYPPMCSLTLPK